MHSHSPSHTIYFGGGFFLHGILIRLLDKSAFYDIFEFRRSRNFVDHQNILMEACVLLEIRREDKDAEEFFWDRNIAFQSAKNIDNTCGVILPSIDIRDIELVAAPVYPGQVRNHRTKVSCLQSKGHTCLDHFVFMSLWRERLLIPQWWESPQGDLHEAFIYFDGTFLGINTRLEEDRISYFTICMYFSGGGWQWTTDPIITGFGSQYPSAVINKKNM